MKIVLFSRPQAEQRAEDLRLIMECIDRYGADYTVNEEFAAAFERYTSHPIPAAHRYGAQLPPQPSGAVMVCYGGDGTLLEGVHRLGAQQLAVVGINGGHLGFLALAPRTGIAEVFDSIADHSLRIEQRTMLSVEGVFDGTQQRLYALNELAVQRLGATMLSIEAQIDGLHTSTYNGDGIIVSTPTGSTAYALSAGGPIIAPACGCMELVPLLPHNLTMRPIVIPDTSEVRLTIRTRHNSAYCSLDNRTFNIANGATITVKRAERLISLAVPHNISFYDTLRNKMMWGIDVR